MILSELRWLREVIRNHKNSFVVNKLKISVLAFSITGLAFYMTIVKSGPLKALDRANLIIGACLVFYSYIALAGATCIVNQCKSIPMKILMCVMMFAAIYIGLSVIVVMDAARSMRI